MNFQLKTVAIRADGCFSVLCCDERPFAVTCERTFDNGRPVIQAGQYRCTATLFVRGKYATYEILVPNHSRILFHRGNTELDSEGCVLVAKSFTLIDGHCAIRDSVPGFREFMALAGDAPAFDLTVSGR